MKIVIPNNNLEERKYVIDVLLGEFLELEYMLEIRDNRDYEFFLENGNKLIIADHFFNKFPKNLEYLSKINVPEKVKFLKNDFIPERDIPAIYGADEFEVKENKIVCGIDIFASSFFMLTRWEEYVDGTRDKRGRFPAYASLSYKNNFLDRPIVNEYAEMLWNMLKKLGLKSSKSKREFEFVLTHDVDRAYKHNTLKSIFKKNLDHIVRNIFSLKSLIKPEKDPWDTYDYLMDISENVGVKSHFMLHSSKSKENYDNDRFLKRISEKILKRGHLIGYHPGTNAYNSLEIFAKDKERIENIIGHKLTFGRQHALKFEVPTTWQIWEDANMKWDSTLGFADREGFRCGTCYPYSVFNIKSRKKLKLKEKPLIVMEGSFVGYQPDTTPEKMKEKIKKLIKTVKKYNGEFVFLWHNSSFNTPMWKPYENIYQEVLCE